MNNCLLACCRSGLESGVIARLRVVGISRIFQALAVLAEASLNPVPIPCELVFSKITSQLCSKPLLRGRVCESYLLGLLTRGSGVLGWTDLSSSLAVPLIPRLSQQ